MPHGPDQLLLELLLILASAKLIGEILERLSLPAVLGEILAGAVLGPHPLTWIHPSNTIDSVAEIGAIFVLFSTGLETNPQDLIRVGRQALLVAVAGILVPFALGFGYMKWLGDATTEAIFVGAAMVATGVGITARVLGDLRVLATRTAKIILGAAVFDNILGMVLLANRGWPCFRRRTGVAAPEHAGCGGGSFCFIHDLHSSPDCAPHSARDGSAFHPACTVDRRPRSVPAAFLAFRQNRHGRYHRRILCRIDVCRLRTSVESAAAGRWDY